MYFSLTFRIQNFIQILVAALAIDSRLFLCLILIIICVGELGSGGIVQALLIQMLGGL
jgi:hypothetical protein